MSTGMLAYFILSLAYVQAQSTPMLLIASIYGLFFLHPPPRPTQ